MKHFVYSEFDSPDEVGSGNRMNAEVLEMIDKARELFGKPIRINSGVRSVAWNQKVNGSKSSSHLKGYAIDVSCDNSADRFRLIEILMLVGFNRLGIAKTFIHVDNDPNKSKNVIWVY